MAISTHGKNSRLWFETTPGGGTKPPAATPVGYTRIDAAYSVNQQFAKDLASSDSFGSEEHTNTVGLKGGTISFEYRFSQAQFAILFTAYNSETPVNVLFRPEGDASGKYQFYADYHVESLDVSSSVGDNINGSVSLRRNAAVTYAAIA